MATCYNMTIVIFGSILSVIESIKSTFIEMTQDKEHIVVGCIHRVPFMELGEFNSDYLANVSESSH